MPEAAGGSMVVVAGDHQGRDLERPDGTTDLSHIRRRRTRRIEQVTGDEHQLDAMLSHQGSHAADRIESGLSQPGAIVWITDPAVGLADLPVRGVENANQN